MALSGVIHHLKWSDYRKVKEPPDHEGFDALTSCVMLSHFRFMIARDGSWKLSSVNVVHKLEPKRTWVVRGRETAYLLSHEQVHYDISAIAARTLEARLRTLGGGDRAQDASGAARDLQDGISTAAQALQDRYDADTDHSQDVTAQAIWAKRVQRALGSQTETIDDLSGWSP